MIQEKEVDFTKLNMQISDSIKKVSIEQQILLFEYLNEMEEHKRKAYDIAYNHLGTSFNILRSNGFKKWVSNKTAK